MLIEISKLGLTTYKGGSVPWLSFGGAALRVAGMTMRVGDKALVVEKYNG